MSRHETPLRRLGRDGPLVPALGLGLMGMSFLYGAVPSDEERFAVLDRALEIGATFWDTSDMYGDSEKLLGKWFNRTGKRDQIFLATKFGFLKGQQGTFNVDSSGEYCKKACDESLKELGVDHIDLFYMHRANPNTPIEETMRAMVELKRQGKIKYIGLSEISSTTLHRAPKIAHIDAVQMEYSLFELSIENAEGKNILAACRELGIALVAYSPLGRGQLTGTLNLKEDISGVGDWRSHFPRFSGDAFESNLKLVNQLRVMADRKDYTVAQLALAWLLKQGEDIIPIPGTRRINYLEENWDSLNCQLSDAEQIEIRQLVTNTKVVGGRTVEAIPDSIFADTAEE